MSGWPMVALGDIATIDRKVVAPDQIPTGTRYLGLEHIERGGRILGGETIGHFTVASSKHLFSDRHILYGKLRPNLGKISRPDFSGVSSTDILPILPGPQVDRSYLFHFLSQDSMILHAATRASGANLPRLSPKELGSFQLPLPPLDEQRRIAAILDHATNLLALRTASFSALESVPRAEFRHHFSDRTLPLIPLGELIADHQLGLVRNSSEIGTERETPYLRMDAITRTGGLSLDQTTNADCTPAEFDKYSLRDGDLIFNTRNTKELVGKSTVYRGERILFNNNILRLRFDDTALPDYIHHYLLSREGRSQLDSRKSGTTSVWAIYLKSLRTVRVPLPDLKSQHLFVDQVTRVRLQTETLRQSQKTIEALINSLQSRAFRGEL